MSRHDQAILFRNKCPGLLRGSSSPVITVTRLTLRGAACHMHVHVFAVELCILPLLHQSGHRGKILPYVLKSPCLWDTVHVCSGIEPS